jgi:hypothetical protein
LTLPTGVGAQVRRISHRAACPPHDEPVVFTTCRVADPDRHDVTSLRCGTEAGY